MAEVKARAGVSGLVLASASPFRRRLLEAAGVAFRVVPAKVDEGAIKRGPGAGLGPAALAETLAAAKAEAVSRECGNALVIGSDQVAALGSRIFDKPADLAEARAHLEALRGKTHRLFTAVTLAQNGHTVWRQSESATLTMRAFSDDFLDRYLAEGGTRLCQMAGAYEIEGRGIQLFERIEGDHFTIVGLPLVPLLAELRARGALPA
ncbi:MAG: Maf family nucleotide pyrophosphatase [Hyphomicrobiaceae bacterium]